MIKNNVYKGMSNKLCIFLSLLMISYVFGDDENILEVETGQTWSLESRSNKLSVGNSKVLYFFPNDAYNTYRARKFSDWDTFSIVDARNLVRLNTGDRVEIIESKYQAKVFEVKLLDGFQKNRKYFLIKEDLLDDFKLMEKENDS